MTHLVTNVLIVIKAQHHHSRTGCLLLTEIRESKMRLIFSVYSVVLSNLCNSYGADFTLAYCTLDSE